MNTWQWGLELALLVLLGATLFYALRLERSIAVLRNDRGALADALGAIRLALDNADRGIQSLQHMADVTSRSLTAEIANAVQAGQDLNFLLDRLETVAAKVELVIKSGRSVAATEDPAGPAKSTSATYSKAERDLLKVLRMSK